MQERAASQDLECDKMSLERQVLAFKHPLNTAQQLTRLKTTRNLQSEMLATISTSDLPLSQD